MENNSIHSNDPIQPPNPGVSEVFGHRWMVLKKHFLELLLVFLVQALLSLPVGFTNTLLNLNEMESLPGSLFNLIYCVLVLIPVSVGYAWVNLKAVRGESFRIQDMFFAYQRIRDILLAYLLIGLVIGIGFVLLIVPGVIFACRLAFVPYLIMDRKMEALEAIRKSWCMTKGSAGTIFLMGIVSFFIIIGGLICLLVGVIPAAMWTSLAFASIYWTISRRVEENSTDIHS